MQMNKLLKYRDIIITGVQTVIILGMAFVLTVLSCGFNLKEFNWIRFIMSFIFTTAMKAIYTAYAKNKALANEDIVTLKMTINKDKREIFDSKITDIFKSEIKRRNDIKKLELYISKLDNKKNTNKEERDWAFDYKNSLIKREDISEYEKKKSLKSIRISYEKIEFSKLFSYGQSSKEHKTSYTFNTLTASLNRALIPTVISTIFSILIGTLQGEAYINTGGLWIDLVMYLFSIGLGAWWGLNNGKSIIEEDYTEVLNNVASIIRELKSDSLKIKSETTSVYNTNNTHHPTDKEVIANGEN